MNKYEEAYKLLQELVDKEKPMKPKTARQTYDFCNSKFVIECCECAICGNIINQNENYCSKCGQKIEWEELEK